MGELAAFMMTRTLTEKRRGRRRICCHRTGYDAEGGRGAPCSYTSLHDIDIVIAIAIVIGIVIDMYVIVAFSQYEQSRKTVSLSVRRLLASLRSPMTS